MGRTTKSARRRSLPVCQQDQASWFHAQYSRRRSVSALLREIWFPQPMTICWAVPPFVNSLKIVLHRSAFCIVEAPQWNQCYIRWLKSASPLRMLINQNDSSMTNIQCKRQCLVLSELIHLLHGITKGLIRITVFMGCFSKLSKSIFSQLWRLQLRHCQIFLRMTILF